MLETVTIDDVYAHAFQVPIGQILDTLFCIRHAQKGNKNIVVQVIYNFAMTSSKLTKYLLSLPNRCPKLVITIDMVLES